MELKLILQIVGFTLGLLYLWLEYRANIYLWLVGLVMPVVHGGISRTPARRWPMIAAAYAAIHLFIYWVLVTFTNSTVPFWDSLTTSLSIVGMWMLSRKYLEQWFVWFVVNLVTVGLYFYKEIPLTALLYTIYLTMSLAGYFRWRRMMRRQMRG